MDTKKCSGECGEFKKLDCFSKNQYYCKSCASKSARKYRQENQGKVKEYNKKWAEENKDKKKENSIKFKKQNNEKYKKITKKANKKWREKNPEKIRKINNRWEVKRRKSDPAFRIHKNVSQSIRSILKNNGSSKGGNSVIKYLPYTFDELIRHLENQFEPWMTRENHGTYKTKYWDDNDPATWKWQLDHIIPQSDLPFQSMEDENFFKAWNLSNLRPLSAKQNLLEGVSRARHNNGN